jgi:hypothetical protein
MAGGSVENHEVDMPTAFDARYQARSGGRLEDQQFLSRSAS